MGERTWESGHGREDMGGRTSERGHGRGYIEKGHGRADMGEGIWEGGHRERTWRVEAISWGHQGVQARA